MNAASALSQGQEEGSIDQADCKAESRESDDRGELPLRVFRLQGLPELHPGDGCRDTFAAQEFEPSPEYRESGHNGEPGWIAEQGSSSGAEQHPGPHHEQAGPHGRQGGGFVPGYQWPAIQNQSEKQAVHQPPLQVAAVTVQADEERDQAEPWDGSLQDSIVLEKAQGEQHGRERSAQENTAPGFFPFIRLVARDGH